MIYVTMQEKGECPARPILASASLPDPLKRIAHQWFPALQSSLFRYIIGTHDRIREKDLICVRLCQDVQKDICIKQNRNQINALTIKKYIQGRNIYIYLKYIFDV